MFARLSESRKNFLQLLGWSLLFICTRLYLVFFQFDRFWAEEELTLGVIGREFERYLRGANSVFGLFHYQSDIQIGGSIVAGFVNALNNLLFGANILSLKLTAIEFGLATLLVTFFWVKREFGLRSAHRFALLYCLASPGFAGIGLFSMGHHGESILFVSCLLGLGFRIQREAQARDWFLFGVVGAFGFWFCNAVGIAALALFFVLRKKASWLPLISGALLGILPWLFLNLTRGFAAANYLMTSFTPAGESGVQLVRIARKALMFLVWNWADFHQLPSFFLSYLYGVLLLGLVFWRRAEKAQFLYQFLLAYVAAFFMLYVSSDKMMSIGPATSTIINGRYLMGAMLSIFILAALQDGSVWQRRAYVGLLVFSSFGLLYEHQGFTPLQSKKGYSYYYLGLNLLEDRFNTPALLPEYRRLVESFPEEEQEAMLRAIEDFSPPTKSGP